MRDEAEGWGWGIKKETCGGEFVSCVLAPDTTEGCVSAHPLCHVKVTLLLIQQLESQTLESCNFELSQHCRLDQLVCLEDIKHTRQHSHTSSQMVIVRLIQGMFHAHAAPNRGRWSDLTNMILPSTWSQPTAINTTVNDRQWIRRCAFHHRKSNWHRWIAHKQSLSWQQTNQQSG